MWGNEVLTLYYFTDKQQKGSFYINGYNVELVSGLRKDSKKNACFEFSAPGRQTFQVGISHGRLTTELSIIDDILESAEQSNNYTILNYTHK